MWTFLHDEGLSFKTSVRPDITRCGEQGSKYQTQVDPARLVFIDETWTKTTMAPLRAGTLRGEAEGERSAWPLEDADLHRGVDPVMAQRAVAPRRPDQRRALLTVPTLKPGDIVIIDNLGSHRAKAIHRAIRAAGAKLFFLPKDSPDLNPIEQLLAKPKHLPRKAAARTADSICDAIAQLLDTFTSLECSNDFTNPAYNRT